jgi:hypothetical protein
LNSKLEIFKRPRMKKKPSKMKVVGLKKLFNLLVDNF